MLHLRDEQWVDNHHLVPLKDLSLMLAEPTRTYCMSQHASRDTATYIGWRRHAAFGANMRG